MAVLSEPGALRMADIVPLLVGLGFFTEPSGITRAVQILMDYFGCRGLVLTDHVAALETRPIRDGRVYMFKTSG